MDQRTIKDMIAEGKAEARKKMKERKMANKKEDKEFLTEWRR